MDYIQYTNSEINTLNKYNVWQSTPIKVQEKKSQEEQKYILHATGTCDMNGRTYVALPSNCNHIDPKIKQKYNLL